LTCIAALVARGRVWIGGDAAVSLEGESVIRQRAPKVFRLGPLVIGLCGACGYEDAWRRAKPRPVGKHAEDWLTSEVFDAVKRGFSGEAKEADESAAVIGIGSALYYADGLSTPWAVHDRYVATGTGSAPAIGVLAALSLPARMRALGLSPRDVVTEALASSALHSEGVREPFTVIST
jgi:ATP-dependent protease HslVU (ClpYQ) peptidase subunit